MHSFNGQGSLVPIIWGQLEFRLAPHQHHYFFFFVLFFAYRCHFGTRPWSPYRRLYHPFLVRTPPPRSRRGREPRGETAILTAPSKPRRVSCICSNDECKQLTIRLQSVDNDIRGLFMQLPCIGGSILVLAGLKEQRVKRTLIHLNQTHLTKILGSHH